MGTRPGLPLLGPGRDRRQETRARQRLERELAQGREHPERGQERLGISGTARPEGPLVWLHCAHESDALDHLTLIERLRLEREEVSFLLTTSVYEPEQPLRGRLPVRCFHQYFPYEEGPGLGRLLEHWQPDSCIWLEEDPNSAAVEALSRHEIPLFWVNAAMPDEKSHKLRWFAGSARRIFGQFSYILAVDGRSARNLRRLGVAEDRLEVLGRLRDLPPPLECAETERERLAARLATRPVWLAVGLDRAEEAPVIGAHRQVSRRAHRYLLILMPSEAGRGARLARELEREGWTVALRSAGQEPGEDTQIFIADEPDELGLMLHLSPIAFFGRTLTDSNEAPEDPFHAAALGAALLHGPGTGAFGPRFARLRSIGAAREVRTEQELARELEYLLAPDKVAEMAQAAWDVTTSGALVSDRLCELVHDALDGRGA